LIITSYAGSETNNTLFPGTVPATSHRECNVFKIKSGGFTYVIRSSGSDKRLTERIFCLHYFGACFFLGG